MNFEIVKSLREKRDLSQVEVAKALSVSVYTYQLIENGVTKRPQPRTRRAIKKFFNISED